MADEGDGKRQQFGNRFLTDPSKVFEHNAWDNVEWGVEQEEAALKKISENSSIVVKEELKDKYENEANHFWDDFYLQHQNRFFKDRHWLFTEFPELETISLSASSEASSEQPGCSSCIEQSGPSECGAQSKRDGVEHYKASRDCGCEEDCNCGPVNKFEFTGCTCEKMKQANMANHSTQHSDNAKKNILEVGCGVGNTVFPVLQTNNDPNLFVYCCDFSENAVDLVKSHDDYNPNRCHAFVCDITQEDFHYPFPRGSLDIITMIFVLSAIRPEQMQTVITRLATYLKPGGLILFRDYGRYDLAQLRFKKGQCLSENFYVRGDGTRVYFFTQDELDAFFTAAGLQKVQNHIDRRLQVNRVRQLRMYRVWIQCKYCKPR